MSASERSQHADDALFAAAVVVSILGGLILSATFVARLPDLLVTVGWLTFMVGLALAFVLGFRETRRDGASVPRSLRHGLRQLWGWLLAFMP